MSKSENEKTNDYLDFETLYQLWETKMAYQELVDRVRLKELDLKRRERIQILQEILLDIIFDLFPTIRVAAREFVEAIKDPLLLRRLIVKLVSFKSADECLQFLHDLNPNQINI